MSKLIIDGNSYEIPDLVPGKLSIESNLGIEESVLSFIEDWHKEEASFEVITSGSTGPPKTLVITKNSMEESARMTANAINLKSGMIAMLAMNPEFIAGKMMIARALTLNMDLVIVPPSSNPLKNWNQSTKIDFIALVPLQIETLIDEGYSEQLNSIEAILVGAAPISPSLAGKIEKLKTSVYHTYGMTETISHIAIRRLNGPEISESYRVLDGIGIDTDSRGCLVISGRFLNGPVITNDQVKIISPHEFKWLGRLDNVINSGGVKINPEIIEPQIAQLLLSQNEQFKRLFLAGVPDDKLGEKMILFVEGSLSNKKDILLNWLRSNLEAYHCPKDIIELEKFELTQSGKLNRGPMVKSYLSITDS